MIGAEVQTACRSSRTVEDPTGFTPRMLTAPRKASIWRGNQPHRTTW
ncbi:hypothetical protein KEH51_12080 [[Brevibacterium] frigoritolerans]|uniref:Uncharacterized protein n=1 Tax=Peribacillus frigoritolerans TaxID=450367 RepID=A0A941J2M6_9BACI|nr:hypothetical protein [Peribacillus frigoritolerans]